MLGVLGDAFAPGVEGFVAEVGVGAFALDVEGHLAGAQAVEGGGVVGVQGHGLAVLEECGFELA